MVNQCVLIHIGGWSTIVERAMEMQLIEGVDISHLQLADDTIFILYGGWWELEQFINGDGVFLYFFWAGKKTEQSIH